MTNHEYRLRNIEGTLVDDERQDLKAIVDIISKRAKVNDSEAVYMDGLIVFPEDQIINEPSNLRINPIHKKKIDYTKKIQKKELQPAFKQLQRESNLLQKDMKKIVTIFNKRLKEFDEQDRVIEEQIKQLEEITNVVVNERNIEKYLNEIERHCNELSSCLTLEDPEVLTEATKKEIRNKLNVLKTYMDEFMEKV